MRFCWVLLLGMACLDEKPVNEDALWVEEDLETRYGPMNNWYHTSVATVNDSGQCGYNAGQQACNFTWPDQNGHEVELYQFWGKVILFDVIWDN
jgi:hypothetical protein